MRAREGGLMKHQDDDDLLTLDQLRKHLGAPDAAQLEATAPEEAREELVKLGAQIRSARILTDSARIYGLAYAAWQKATAEQKETLLGFSEQLLAVAVDRALALRALSGDADEAQHADTTRAAELARAAQDAFSRGMIRRDHLYTALRTIAGRDAALRARVDAARGTAEDAEALARGLSRLAKLGRELCGHKKGPLAARVKLARLSEKHLAAIDALAEEVKASARAAAGRATAQKTAQGDVDHLDGVNLALLGDIVSAFESAHDLDPTIPRLVPIATRRFLGKHTRKKPGAPAEPPAEKTES